MPTDLLRAIRNRLRTRTRRRLIVPEAFNRNSATVTALMPPEQSGAWLLERMREQIGFESYADVKLLDIGCGVRFSQAIIHSRLRIRRYFGVDCHRPLIEFLQQNARDPRLGYAFWDTQHPLFNPGGTRLSLAAELPTAERDFDIAAMFSVITHQDPEHSRCLFTILRRHVRAGGHLFFSCFLDPAIAEFEDRSPARNGGRCFYHPGYLRQLVESCGWQEVSSAGSAGPLIGDSFVYRPS
jgi:SAM-dependent methyltransferase